MIELIKQVFIYKIQFRKKHLKCGFFSRITKRSKVGDQCRIGKFSYFDGKIGNYSYIGDHSRIMAEVGSFCSISSKVKVVNGRHPLRAPFVSTSPLFYSTSTPFGFSFVNDTLFEEYTYANIEKKIPVVIDNDVWIGYGVSIIEGVHIADGAVVLANATVTKDVPPFAIVGGVPAKILGYRYEENIIKKILGIKWWNKELEWIKDNAYLFSNIESFIR